MGRKKEEPPEIEESDGEFAAVFSDLMSFWRAFPLSCLPL